MKITPKNRPLVTIDGPFLDFVTCSRNIRPLDKLNNGKKLLLSLSSSTESLNFQVTS